MIYLQYLQIIMNHVFDHFAHFRASQLLYHHPFIVEPSW